MRCKRGESGSWRSRRGEWSESRSRKRRRKTMRRCDAVKRWRGDSKVEWLTFKMNGREIKELFVTSPKVGCSDLWIRCLYLHIFVRGEMLKWVSVCAYMCCFPVMQDVDASEIKVQVCVYAFDLLYLNGEVRPDVDEDNFPQRSLSLLPCVC